GQSSTVQVPLSCHEAPRTGSVTVNGTLNLCPTIDGVSANPAEANVGAGIALSAVAHDSHAGPQALGYAWQASGAGSITAGGNTASPTLTCNTPGMATVSVTVSDG